MNLLFSYSDPDVRSLVERLYPRLTAYIGKALGIGRGMDAKDVFHDVLLKFLELRAPIPADKVEHYLFRAVRNRCLNLNIRMPAGRLVHPGQEAWERLCEIDFAEAEETDESPSSLLDLRLSDVLSFADTLPPRTREVFVKSRIERKKQDEIAAEMGISLRAVQKHITLSIRKFREGFLGAEEAV